MKLSETGNIAVPLKEQERSGGWKVQRHPQPNPRPTAISPGACLTSCAVSEWIYLNEGHRVVVQRTWEYPRAGVIDIVSEDAFTFWVWLDEGKGRVMITAQEDAKVWLVS